MLVMSPDQISDIVDTIHPKQRADAAVACNDGDSAEANTSASAATIPSEFICPLTLEIMENPMLNRYGFSFERDAILGWLERGHFHCPLTRQPMTLRDLVSNRVLQNKIEWWRRDHGEPDLPEHNPSGWTFDAYEMESEHITLPPFLATVQMIHAKNKTKHHHRSHSHRHHHHHHHHQHTSRGGGGTSAAETTSATAVAAAAAATPSPSSPPQSVAHSVAASLHLPRFWARGHHRSS